MNGHCDFEENGVKGAMIGMNYFDHAEPVGLIIDEETVNGHCNFHENVGMDAEPVGLIDQHNDYPQANGVAMKVRMNVPYIDGTSRLTCPFLSLVGHNFGCFDLLLTAGGADDRARSRPDAEVLQSTVGMNPSTWLLTKGPTVVKLPGCFKLICPLPYWNTKDSDAYDLSPYVDESVTSLTVTQIPDFGYVELNELLLRYRGPQGSPWQCALLLHAATDDGRDEYTVLVVDSGFDDEKVDDDRNAQLLSGMSDFSYVVGMGDENLGSVNGLIDLGHTYS